MTTIETRRRRAAGADSLPRLAAWTLAGAVVLFVLGAVGLDTPVFRVGGTVPVLAGIVLLAVAVAAIVFPSRTQVVRLWLRAFRRTRPFWGGAALLLGGWLVLSLSMVSVRLVVSGISGAGGWLTGGGMILCGLAAWAAPSQRYVVGVVGLLLAVSSLIVSNLGGFFIGMFFGIIGGAMTLAWGPKRAKPAGDRKYQLGLLGIAARPAVVEPAPAPRPRPRPRPTPRG